jgi:tetratricopeptide (TPR) repeat protein
MLLVAVTGLADTYDDAQTAFKNKKYKQAVKLLDEHLKENKDDAKAYLLRGRAHAQTNADVKALADFNKAIELTPKNPPAYIQRGQLLATMGKFDEALTDLDKAVELAPKQPATYVARGFLFLDSKLADGKDKALKDFDQAVKLTPELPRAYLGRARAILEKSPRVAVIKEGDKVFTVITGVQPMAAKQALPDLDKAIALLPKSAQAYLLRATCHEALGDETKEVADRKEVATLDKINARNLNQLAWILASSANKDVRDGKTAVTAAKQAVELTKGADAYILDTLACAHAAAGDFAEAVATQEKVIAMLKAPANSVFHERLELYKKKQPYRVPAREPSTPPTPPKPGNP